MTSELKPRPVVDQPLVPVFLESPFAANDSASQEDHERYLEACIRDCIERGEAPYASHRLYPGVLDDSDPMERTLGIACGEVWRRFATKIVVYQDYGVSRGMLEGLRSTLTLGEETGIWIPIEYRTIGRLPTTDLPIFKED